MASAHLRRACVCVGVYVNECVCVCVWRVDSVVFPSDCVLSVSTEGQFRVSVLNPVHLLDILLSLSGTCYVSYTIL